MFYIGGGGLWSISKVNINMNAPLVISVLTYLCYDSFLSYLGVGGSSVCGALLHF